ncbi:hypothetical protein AgCh_035182 [Apium graveolens]
MARLQQTQRKRVGSVPRLPDDVVAALAAEVGGRSVDTITGWSDRFTGTTKSDPKWRILIPLVVAKDYQAHDLLYLMTPTLQHGKRDCVRIPTKTVDDIIVKKKVSEYNLEEEGTMNRASKAEMVLTSALAEKEYKRVNKCKSAQEMWNKLVVTYEGTIDIKDSRMETLIQEYENFKLQERENIIDMETRFTRIIDELSQLGKNYTQNEKNRRVLKSLPPSWKVKVTTIKEMHNLNEYKIDNLFGNLRAYEEDNIPEKVTPKVDDKKKNMALKAILINENDNDEELNEELQDLNESEITLLTRQLRRVLQSKAQRYEKGFLKSNNQQRVFNSNRRPNYSQNYSSNYKSNFPSMSYNKGKGNQNMNTYSNANVSTNHPVYTPPKPKDASPEETQDVYFKCKQPGHYKRECPKISKGRSLVAENGWDLSEDEEAPEASEEVVNLCLMALGDETASMEVSTTNQEIQNESNAQTTSKDNLDKEKELLETNELTIDAQRLNEENHKLIAQVKDQERFLNNKIDALKKDNENLENVIQRFTKGNKMLDQMVCLAAKQDIWYLDSGCSRYMTGNKSLLNNIKKVIVGNVTFGDNSKGNIVGIGDTSNDKVKISDVQLVTGLKYNLLSVGQLCNNEYKNKTIVYIRTDHGKEFENSSFTNFCDEHGITHNFSAPYTPQSNGVVEQKNRTLQEMASTMLNEYHRPKYFWAEAMSTACHILNRVLLRPIKKKTPYELYFGKTPKLSYFRVFGSKCFRLNSKEYLKKFDSKSDEGIFLGYSNNSKAYRVFNLKSLVVEESMNVAFDESKPPVKYKDLVDQENIEQDDIENIIRQFENMDIGTPVYKNPLEIDEKEDELPKAIHTIKSHPLDNVLGDLKKGVQTRSQVQNVVNHLSFLSQIEPKTAKEALLDEDWISAMQEELLQFSRSKVWELVPKPRDTSIISTKWVF